MYVEREEAFLAKLNLAVKNATLQDSLDQFVKGELLEGDNAYFCDKCGEMGQGSYTYTYIYKSNILRTIALLKFIFTYDLVCRKCLWRRTDIFSEMQDEMWAVL